jgi:integrase
VPECRRRSSAPRARRLAEIGCTAHQIAAITGHASLSEVQRYTKAADRKRMAREAMAKLIEKDGEQNCKSFCPA